MPTPDSLTRSERLDPRMQVSEAESPAESYAKQAVTWAAVAYGFGFVTVMLHTWRLGLPVIELIHPIYVWVGLPLAAFAYFSRRIVALFRKAVSALAVEMREGWAHAAAPETKGNVDWAADSIAFLKAFSLGALLSRRISNIFENAFLPGLKQFVDQMKDHYPKFVEKATPSLRRLFGIARVLGACFVAFILFEYAILICLALYFYVWELYPKIPLSLGGGKPSLVSLTVETNALPKGLAPGVSASSAIGATPSRKDTVSLQVSLLYLTKESYYVCTSSGTKVSINADAVKSVVWQEGIGVTR